MANLFLCNVNLSEAGSSVESDISQVFKMDDILGVLEEIQGNRQGENVVRVALTVDIDTQTKFLLPVYYHEAIT